MLDTVRNNTVRKNTALSDPSAWFKKDFDAEAAFVAPVSEKCLQELVKSADRTSGRPFSSITRSDFDASSICGLAESMQSALLHGRGVVRLRHPALASLGDDVLARIFWGLGRHFGTAAVQNKKGEVIENVTVSSERVTNNGFKSDHELAFHTDAFELLGLLCLHPAFSGGQSRVVSAATAYNCVLRERADLMPYLMEGYWYLATEGLGKPDAMTACRVPVLSFEAGRINCMYLPKFMRNAATQRNEQLSAGLQEALSFFGSVINRDEHVVEFSLQRGDMMFAHNYTSLHARTKFEDGAGPKRHLLRLWITPFTPRTSHPGLIERSSIYARQFRPDCAGCGGHACVHVEA
jgi:hypothetical protein